MAVGDERWADGTVKHRVHMPDGSVYTIRHSSVGVSCPLTDRDRQDVIDGKATWVEVWGRYGMEPPRTVDGEHEEDCSDE